MDLTVTYTGIINVNIDCKNEGYNIVGSKVTLTGLSDPTDCLTKAFSTYGFKDV
jgi:hypothetical protein